MNYMTCSNKISILSLQYNLKTNYYISTLLLTQKEKSNHEWNIKAKSRYNHCSWNHVYPTRNHQITIYVYNSLPQIVKMIEITPKWPLELRSFANVRFLLISYWQVECFQNVVRLVHMRHIRTTGSLTILHRI